MRRLLGIAVVSVLVLAACGDDDGGSGALSSDEQAFVDEAMEEFDAEDAAPLTEEEARCIAEEMVGTLGVDRLEDLGIEPSDFADDEAFPEGLTEDEATEVVDRWDECFDLSELFMQSIAQDQELSDEDRECLEDAFSADTLRNVFVKILTKGEQAMQEDPELLSELLAGAAKCPGLLGG